VLVRTAAGADQDTPLFVETEKWMSDSDPSREPHTAIQVPAPFVVSCGEISNKESLVASVLSAAAADQVPPLFVETEKRTSSSDPIVPPRVSLESHTTIQVPAPFVVSCGTDPAWLLIVASADQDSPLFVETEKRIVPSEVHTAIQVPAPSVVSCGQSSLTPKSVAAFVLR
jgi:hypothetical protein